MNYKSLNYSLLDQGLVSLSNFLSTIISAKLLGLEQFGIFATYWLVVLFINSIHSSLIVLPMMSQIPKQKMRQVYFGSILAHQLIFIFFGFIVSGVVLWIYGEYSSLGTDWKEILIFSLLVIFYHMQDFYRRYFFAIKAYGDVLYLDGLTYFIRIIVLGYSLYYSAALMLSDILSIYMLTFAFGVVFGVIRYKYLIEKQQIANHFQENWKLSKWLLPSGLMQWSSVNLFVVVASIILGPVAVGVIRIGQNIALAINVILQGMENFLPIDAAKIYQESGHLALEGYLKKVIAVGGVAVTSFACVISYFSSDLISILYGPDYLEFHHVIFWYSLIVVCMFLFTIARVYLRTIEQTRLWFKGYLVTSVYSIIIAYPLLLLLDLNGVMVGILSAYVVLLVSVVYFVKKEFSNVSQ